MDQQFWHILLHHLQTVLSVHQFFRSLIYMRNRSGPMPLPWTMPLINSATTDKDIPTRVWWLRLHWLNMTLKSRYCAAMQHRDQWRRLGRWKLEDAHHKNIIGLYIVGYWMLWKHARMEHICGLVRASNCQRYSASGAGALHPSDPMARGSAQDPHYRISVVKLRQVYCWVCEWKEI